MLPVLIGSKALEYYGYPGPARDIDLLVDLPTCKDVHFLVDKKENGVCWLGGVLLDVTIASDEADKYIYEVCNERQHQIVKLASKLDVILPSLEMLYFIKRSHIHRILPLTKNNSNDLEIWKKSMKMYAWMRDKLGYQRMDAILERDDCDEENFLLRRLFYLKFDQATSTFGDTNITMDKSNDDFFKDNVERFIDHDELHKKVAMMCRNEETELYDLFKVDKTVAALDKDLFLKGDANLKIQCMREEIMVLFLERKWIPELKKCYLDEDRVCSNFDSNNKLVELDEIIAHFITNLCGQGHAWLRQYCLDHYQILGNLESYDLNGLFQLACQIVGMDELKKKHAEQAEKDSVVNIDKILENDIDNEYTFRNIFGYDYDECDYGSDITYRDYDKPYRNFYDDDDDESETYNRYFYFTVIDINNPSKIKKRYLNFYTKDDEKSKYLDIIDDYNKILFCDIKDKSSWSYDSENEYSFHFVIYNVKKNIGMMVGEYSSTILFYVDIDNSGSGLKVSGQEVTISSSSSIYSIDFGFEKSIKCYYYYSRDKSCGWRNKNLAGETKYLSSYGTGDSDLKKFFEVIARHALNIAKDEKYNGDHDDSDSY